MLYRVVFLRYRSRTAAAAAALKARSISHRDIVLSSPVAGVLGASFAIVTARSVVSVFPSASAKSLPQASQDQYSLLPAALLVAAFASWCVSL